MNDTSRIESLLENLPPNISTRLEKRLSSAPWTPRGIKRRQTLTLLTVTIILLAAFIGLTPHGRAFAQSIFKFFTTTDQSSIPLSTEEINTFFAPAPTHALWLVEVAPVVVPCSNSEGTGMYECEVQDIEKQLNIDLKEFSTMPAGWTFIKVQLYSEVSASDLATYPAAWLTTHSVVDISYQNSDGGLYLHQGIGDFPPDSDWEKVPVSAIETVRIGKSNGEYVNGAWGLRNGAAQLTWEAGTEQRIRWKEDERWFEIIEFADPGTPWYLDKQTLISLASTMVYRPKPSKQTTNVDLEFIPNIVLAEKICGCDILQPTKLPNEDTHFDHARYDPQQRSIILNYGSRALRIVQTPTESALFTNLNRYKDVETVQVGDAVGQYGISPAEKSIWDSATPPAFPINNAYSVLLWQKDDMVYQIYFDQSFSNGG